MSPTIKPTIRTFLIIFLPWTVLAVVSPGRNLAVILSTDLRYVRISALNPGNGAWRKSGAVCLGLEPEPAFSKV